MPLGILRVQNLHNSLVLLDSFQEPFHFYFHLVQFFLEETVLVLDVFVLVQKDLDHVGVLRPLAMFAVTEGDWLLGLGWELLVGVWVGGEEGLGFAGRFGQLLSAVVQAPGVCAFFGAQHSKL